MQKHIRISWDDEAQTILRRDADYGWTWTELDAANAEMAEILDAVEHNVCTLVVQNYSESYIPSNAITRLGTMLPGKHPRVLLSVVVSRNTVVRSIIRLLTMVYPRASHLRYAENIEEARQLIKAFLAQEHS